MAEHEGQLQPVEVAVDDVQVRPTDAARVDAEAHLSVLRFRLGNVRETERLAGSLEEDRAHHRRA
jgi:hypothetical protein